MIKKFPNSGIGIMQDVLQIEAFRIPLHVELTEVLGFYFDLVLNCAVLTSVCSLSRAAAAVFFSSFFNWP